MPIQAIHVGELLHKSDPVAAKKLTVLRCLRSYEHEEVNWALDQVVRELKESLPELEVADVFLPTYRIGTSVSNDPDDKRFDPMDQFPAVLEPIEHADVILVGVCASVGLPHSNMVRVLERLGEASRGQQSDGKPAILEHKAAGVVVLGDGAGTAGGVLTGALLELGAFPAGCACFTGKGKAFKSDEFAATLDGLATRLTELASLR